MQSIEDSRRGKAATDDDNLVIDAIKEIRQNDNLAHRSDRFKVGVCPYMYDALTVGVLDDGTASPA